MRRKWIVFGLGAYLWAADEKPLSYPLSTTERLAFTSLQERQRLLNEDSRAFATEVCSLRSIKLDECSINPESYTVSRVMKPPAPPK